MYHHKNGSQSLVDYIVEEHVDGFELWDIIAIPRLPFKESICRYYFKQMLQVMHYVHSKGVAHRDLKPENIMLDENFNIKIADFGFAAPLQGRDGSGYL